MDDPSIPDPPDVRIHAAVPTFLVNDVGTTARWYAERLGFQIAGSFPDEEPWAYASLMLGGAEIMLLGHAGYQKPDLTGLRPSGVWDAYIRMNGVRALFASVENEAFIHGTLVLRPYGDWEFEVRDPNGYLIVFGGGEDA
jgi:hypothetical protein